MTCIVCGQSVLNNVKDGKFRYCKCRACNWCHIGGVCPQADSNGQRYWYRNARERGNREKMDPCQSHGGHDYVPDSR